MTQEASQLTLNNCIDLSSTGLLCDFESECPWNWTRPTDNTAGFQNISFEEVKRLAMTEPRYTFAGPTKPAENDTNGECSFIVSCLPCNYSVLNNKIW